MLVEGEEDGAERAEQQPRVALRGEESFRVFVAPTVRCSPCYPQILKKTIRYMLLLIFGSYGIRHVTCFSICTCNKTGVKRPNCIRPLRVQVLLQPRGRKQRLVREWALLHFLSLPTGTSGPLLPVPLTLCTLPSPFPSPSCSSFPPTPPDPWKLGSCAKCMNISLH